MALTPIAPVTGKVVTPDDELAAAAHWMPTAKAAADLQPDIAFWLRETVYVGDPNGSAELRDPRYNPVVELPRFARLEREWATTAEVAGNEAELVGYFQRVRALLRKRPPEKLSQRALKVLFDQPADAAYWLRLRLSSAQAGANIGFPWYDTVRGMREILAWLRTDEAPMFSDLEQGWDVQAIRQDGRLYFREGDFDSGETHTTLWVDEAVFRPRFAAFEARALPMIRWFGRKLGVRTWR